jgi:Domain of unknown function (DUF6242)/Galactose oxidase, central domain
MKTKIVIFLGVACFFASVLISGCKKTELSTLSGILTFSFTDNSAKSFTFTVDNIGMTITNKDSLPYQTNISSLTAQYTAVINNTVKVGTAIQISGSTANNFTSPVNYICVAQDGVTLKTYVVTVNVSKVDPEAVPWVQKTPTAFGSGYPYQSYFFLNGKHHIIASNSFAWFVNDPDVKTYQSTDGISWSELPLDSSFPLGYSYEVVVNNGKAYMLQFVGAAEVYGAKQPTILNTVYSSTDGVVWTQSNNLLPTTALTNNVGVLNNNLYVMGGGTIGAFGAFDGSRPNGSTFYPAAAYSDTTMTSIGGGSWTKTAMLPASAANRRYTANCVFNNKFYMIGGQDPNGNVLKDVWSSTDGLTWTQVSNGAFSARQKASVVAYNNQLWMIGGQDETGAYLKDIVISADNGLTWNVVPADKTLPAAFTPRGNARLYVDANSILWIIGGEQTNPEDTDFLAPHAVTDIWTGKLNKLK